MKINKSLALILILFFSFCLRVYKLGQFPVAIAHDAMDYIINSKAIWLTGKDISGTWSPFSLTAKNIGTPTSELLSLLASPISGPLKNSFFNARLPYVLFGIIFIYSVYLTTNFLIGKKTALLSALLLAINPWSFHFSRIAFDAPVAICFYVIALYFLISQKSWKILYSLPFLGIAFSTYHGTKALFIPFVAAALIIRYLIFKTKDKSKKPALIISIFSIVLMLYFVFSLKYQAAGKRSNEVLFFSTEKISQAVNQDRRSSFQTPLNAIFSNKLTYIIKTFISQYLGAFSVDNLFIHGEQTGAFSNWIHGEFYYIDILFIAIGFIALFQKKRKAFASLIILMLVAPIPSAISTTKLSYTLRSSLVVPLLIIIISYGIISLVKKIKYKKTAIATLGFLYLMFFANYLYIYFFRYPVYGSEGFFYSDRVLSSYIKRVPDKTIILTKEPDTLYSQYLFYSDSYNKAIASQVASNIQNKNYTLGNKIFTDNCQTIKPSIAEGITIISLSGFSCENELATFQKNLDISNTADAGSIYNIYNDRLCTNYKKSPYPQIKTSQDFNVEAMNDEAFCQTWINQKN